MVIREKAFPAVELFGVDTTPPTGELLIGNDRVQHFVEENVLKEPAGDKVLVERGVNAYHPVLLLNGPENEVLFWTLPAAASPFHIVIPHAAAKILRIQFREDIVQVEVPSFLLQVQMSLHWKTRMRQFSLGLFSHNNPCPNEDLDEKFYVP